MIKIKNKDMKCMESLFRKIRKNNGLNKQELEEIINLSSRFLYLAKASLLTKQNEI
jgi:hypothetical protein